MLKSYETAPQANAGWNQELGVWIKAHQIVGAGVPTTPLKWITPAILTQFMSVGPSGVPLATAIETHILTTTLMVDSQTTPPYVVTLVVPALSLPVLLFSKGNSASAEDIQKLFYQWLQSIAVTVVDAVPVTYPCTIMEI